MSPLLYWTLLTLTCGYALSRGHRDERIAAFVAIVASIVTAFVLPPKGERYSRVESGELLVDLVVLSIFIAIALRSDRFWPLWIAGLQLTTSMAHLMKAVHVDLMPQAYAAAEKFWSYPIILIIGLAAWRSRHQARRNRSAGTT